MIAENQIKTRYAAISGQHIKIFSKIIELASGTKTYNYLLYWPGTFHA